MTDLSPPRIWSQLCTHHRAAEVAQVQMKDAAATQIARDEATIRYARACDGIVACLTALSEIGSLERITKALARKGWR